MLRKETAKGRPPVPHWRNRWRERPVLATHWRDLTPQQRTDRLDAMSDLLNLLQWHRGDPKLNSWEEGFLTGIVRLLETYRGRVEPSPKQWLKINSTLDRLDAEEPAMEEAD
jgi:hypothetical protein